MPYWNRQKHVFWSLKQQERRLDRKIAREAEEALLPEINAAFVSDTYLKNADATTFSTLFTHTRAGLATQYDSAGVLKWAPHNFATNSQGGSMSNSLSVSNVSVTDNATTAPDGTVSACKIIEDTSNSAHTAQNLTVVDSTWPETTRKVWIKKAERTRVAVGATSTVGTAVDYVVFDLEAGTTLTTNLAGSGVWSVSEAGDGWYLFSLSEYTNTSRTRIAIQLLEDDDTDVDSYTGDGASGIFVWGIHGYRSDLGGMVNNPDRGDSYVPTTDSAVYLPRRNAHWYDGSAWQKGIQIETEARTNLLLNSETPATQSVTVTDATQYTLWVEGSGSAEITAGGSGTATDGSHLTFTTTGTSVTVTVTGSLDRFQLEQGPTPSSYIPTAGSSVTRAADTLKVPSGQTAYNSEAMSFAMKGVCTYADTGSSTEAIFMRWRADFTNFIDWYLSTNAGNTGSVFIRQEESGTRDSVNSNNTYSPGVNVPFSIASRHTDHDINGAVDGTALTADTTPTALPDLSTTDLELAPDFMGILTEFKMWDRGLADEELESETA